MAYDGFEDGTYDLWTKSGAGSTVSVVEAAQRYGVYGLRYVTDGNNDNQSTILKNTALNEATGNYYYSCRFTNKNGRFYNVGYDGALNYVWSFTVNEGTLYYSDGTSGDVAFSQGIDNNTWYRFRVERTDTNKVSYYLYDAAEALLESHIDIPPQVPAGVGNTVEIRMAINDHSGTADTVDFDNYTYSSTAEPGPPAGGAQLNTRKYW